MAAVTCSSCGKSVDEADTYFGESGQVCGVCHANTEAEDAARFREAADPNSLSGGLADGSFHKTSTHVDDDGRVVTRTVSVDAGPIGMIIKLIMEIFRKLTAKS